MTENTANIKSSIKNILAHSYKKKKTKKIVFRRFIQKKYCLKLEKRFKTVSNLKRTENNNQKRARNNPFPKKV